MKKYIFKYRRRIVKGQVRYYPEVVVSIEDKQGNWRTFYLYLDSGADLTILTYSDAKNLGIKLKKEKAIYLRGVSGARVKIYLAKINLKIGDTQRRITVGFSDSNETPRLLGRKDVFKDFYICFDENEKQACFILKDKETRRKFGRLIF